MIGLNATHLSELQQSQEKYDDQFFDINEGFEKQRHITLHLMMSISKIAAQCEMWEHGLTPDPAPMLNDALPDLLMHAMQIANLHNIDLEEKYHERVEANIKRRTQQTD